MQPPTTHTPSSDTARPDPGQPTSPTDTTSTHPESQATRGGAPAVGELQLPVVVGGRYRLEELRGGGGMAKVYRGIDLTLEREVAVKIINPELRSDAEFDARFQREARIASQLADPHIVVVHDFGLDPALGPYLVMEYLHGLSLRERLNAEGPLPVKAGLQLAGQLLLALVHAHDKGIVHRDVKPDNVFLLNQSGVRLHTRILDFGIARIYRDDAPAQQQTAITHAGAVLGTPRYMAPEQLAGLPIDARTDLFAAALVIFESITGQLPYAQQKKLPELCPEATPQLQELLEDCLKQAPADRPASALEVYLRLQELGKASGVLLLPPGALTRFAAARKSHEPTVAYAAAPPAGRPSRRRWLLAGAAAGLLLLAALACKWLFFSNPTFPPGPESVHGIHVGDTADAVEQQVSLASIDRGNPWKLERTRDRMGHALTPNDLGLSDADLANLTIRWTADHHIQILFHNDRVVALVTTQRAARSNRGVVVGGNVYRMLTNYDDVGAEITDVRLPAGGHVEVRRYPELGVGFEVRAGRVTGTALFPARKP